MLSLIAFTLILQGSAASTDPVAALQKTPDIINYWNYTVETHTITSPDGYKLTLFRIPYGKNGPGNYTQREPVVVQHGLLCSSADWLVMDGPNNLPFMLADAGYEVWLPNARGTSYSDKHVTFDSEKDEQYWNYSFDEMGRYDIPTIIDFVLNIASTKQGRPITQLSWVGHSLGAGSFFVGMHYKPSYASKVRKLVGIAPAAYVCFSSSTVLGISLLPDPVFEASVSALTKGAFLPAVTNTVFHDYASQYCNNDIGGAACSGVFNFISGDPFHNQIDDITAARVVSHTPDTISVRTLTHYLQNFKTCQFGNQTNNVDTLAPNLRPLIDLTPNVDTITSLLNLGRRKRSLLNPIVGLLNPSTTTQSPPTCSQSSGTCKSGAASGRTKYNLGNTNMPTLFLYGGRDTLAGGGASKTYDELGSVQKQQIFLPNYNHLDFTYGVNATQDVFNPILTFLLEGTTSF